MKVNHGVCRIGVALSVLTMSLVGCGGSNTPELADVEGTVTLDGKALAGALVTFNPLDGEKPAGRPSFARTDSNGHYEMVYTDEAEGTIIGTHSVSISTQLDGDPDSEDPKMQKSAPERLPAKYHLNAFDNPDMRVQVKPGSNELNFDLDSKGEVLTEKDVEAKDE